MFRNFIAVCDHYITRDNGDVSFSRDYLKPVTSFYLSKVKKIEQPNSPKNETIHEVSYIQFILFNFDYYAVIIKLKQNLNCLGVAFSFLFININ